MQIIRYHELEAVPWKNGGGVTREVLRRPRAGAFRWRLSLAEVAESGPFSDFTGYRRIMVLLAGQGVRLRFAGAVTGALHRPGDLIEFDGAVRTECELIDGRCLDLNLIVDTRAPPVAAQVLHEPALLSAAGPLLLVALEPCIAQHSAGPLTSEVVRLERGDTVWLEDGARTLRIERATGGGGEGCAIAASAGSAAPLAFMAEHLEP